MKNYLKERISSILKGVNLGSSFGVFGKTISGYGLAKIIPGILALVTVPLWVRIFGESAYASYGVIWVITNLSGSLFVGWLRQAVLRYSGHNKKMVDAIPYVILLTSFLGSGFSCAIGSAFLVAKLNETEDFPILLIIVFCQAILTSVYFVLLSQAQSEGRVLSYTSAEIIRSGLALLISLMFIRLNFASPVIVMVGSFAIATVIAFIPLVKKRKKERVEKSISVAREFFRFGWPLSVWLLFSQLLVYSDRIILSLFTNSDSVGAYVATSDLIVRGIGMATFPIIMVSHPTIMRTWNAGDRSKADNINRTYFFVTVVIASLLVVITTIYGQSFIGLLTGIKPPSQTTVFFLVTGAALWQIGLIAHKPLEMRDQTKQMMWMLILSSMVTISLQFILIPLFGTAGASSSFAIGALCYVLIVNIQFKRYTAKRAYGL